MIEDINYYKKKEGPAKRRTTQYRILK